MRAYRRGARRRRLYLRAIRKRRDLTAVQNRTRQIRPNDILLICTLRNELKRLPFFLDYYRDLGIGHFLIVDNGSTDGSREYLAQQGDVSLWTTSESYAKSRFGVDWVNWLARRYGLGKWILCVDVDEFFIYPFCDTRPIRALTDWLDASEIRSFGTLMLDMYPKGAASDVSYTPGQDPVEICSWFDAGNYTISRNWEYASLWVQGGPRARKFFADKPYEAPALNKIPLVKWGRGNVFVSSTHTLLPRGLNLVFDDQGGEKACGCLLHVKFLDAFLNRSEDEMHRAEHYKAGREYRTYAEKLREDPELWCKWSEQYINWRQLEILGLMSKGNWA
nr:glycosyltransferase family 2 protein [Palleronia pontilimi]